MNPTSPAASARKNLTVKTIAVGGAGQNLARHLIARGPGEMLCAVVNTCPPPAGFAAEYFAVDARAVRELEVADPLGSDTAMSPCAAALKAWCAGADVVFVIAGLGGKAGGGLCASVARIARETGALVLGFATLPFDCEGSRRQQQAQKGLERFRAAADGVICLSNQKICRLIDENTSLLDTFKISNDLLADGVHGVWQLLGYRGLMEIHFDDLAAMLRDRHMECLFATAEASGEHRARNVVEKLLAHPLLDGGRDLTGASSVLVSLMGGSNLSLGEVNRVMEEINRRCDGSQIMVGAAVDAAMGDRLTVTVIASRRQRTFSAVENMGAAETTVLGGQLLTPEEEVAPVAPRFVPPAPSLEPDKAEQLIARQAGGRRGRKGGSRLRQEQLPLELHSRGRFEKSEPTIRNGEDLDEPTYIRRGLVLN